jgi:uncharacterized protein
MMSGKISVPTKVAAALAFCAVLAFSAMEAPAARGEEIIKSLPRPGDREFVRDLADMLSPEYEQRIKTRCDELLTAKATPIIVVTIKSMADHGGRGMRIETFARLLFDQWEVGAAKVNGQSWNTDIMLLVSKGDRKARIELGGGWRREKDDQCADIMEELIIPKFKIGEFAYGIMIGVKGLDKMARDLKIPRRPWSMEYSLGVIGAVVLGAFTIVSLCRRGTSGWAWLFWSQLLAALGTMLYILGEIAAENNDGFSGGSSDGGFFGGGSSGGGSFSGGFSGGGGATGSW